ncbi:MAG: right-handed parallel beta-helix repeat-containing protein [Candidatus Bipolaricaulota bacterium]|nr:right-handed parallel beta-helix repeat-containing protein [Candidatus Bipolaricaulota bacterium]MDW8031676.1 right-handed parallel beta-helix repeat-containing protein [Candidatus Bipolaricaulota bacterium]
MKHWGLARLALVIGLISVLIHFPQALGLQGGCTWTVCAQGCDFATIQQAIEAAHPGDTIKIEAGLYTENLVITKDLSLIGVGPKQTVVKALTSDKPILYVPGDNKVRISIHGMAFAGIPRSMASPLCSGPENYGQCPVGIEVGGEAALTLRWVHLEDLPGGIWGHGNSTARVSYTEIRNPGWYGLLLEGTADFTIGDSVINSSLNPGSDYTPERYGVLMRGDARLWMGATSITSNYNLVAIKLESQTQATIEFGQIERNREGIRLHDDARATILNSAIMASPGSGIYAQDRAQFALNYSLLALNSHGNASGAVRVVHESKASLYKTNLILNGAGIVAADSAQVILNYNRLLRNLWGVLLYVKPCFLFAPEQAKVTILGQGNEIPARKDNPEDGNIEPLCPPDYPWPPGFRK